jgi:hypothetical protein
MVVGSSGQVVVSSRSDALRRNGLLATLRVAEGGQETRGMAIRKRGKFWCGDTAADIREVLARDHGKIHPIAVFEDAFCDCGGRVFSLQVDEDYGEATW